MYLSYTSPITGQSLILISYLAEAESKLSNLCNGLVVLGRIYTRAAAMGLAG